MLPEVPPNDGDWNALRERLVERFPDFPLYRDIATLDSSTCLAARGEQDLAELLIDVEGGATRVQVLQELPEDFALHLHNAANLTVKAEQQDYAIHHAPNPIWTCDEEGRVLSVNAAYSALQHMCETNLKSDGDPYPNLFDVLPRPGQTGPARVAVRTSGSDRPHWFDIHTVRLGSTLCCYALDVNATVNSEIAQRNFVQTLAKTFAQLSIGLAIFDRHRQLVLFNPALIDLTDLPVEFLSGRPTLFSFFDRMRETKMMPEPKNYTSWRDNIVRLAEEALDGTYSELWTMPSGLTYRINGRPHPDGALAFLFEDITAEIALTRGFRAELALGQSILDSLDDAVAVFAQTGTLSVSNKSFRTLWNIEPDSAFAEFTIYDCMRLWQAECKPSPFWGDLRDFIVGGMERAEWDATVQLWHDDSKVHCRVVPAAGGSTIVNFQRIPDDAASLNAPPAEFEDATS